MRIYYSVILLLAGLLSVTAQIPAGYYSGATGKKGAVLKTALHQKIRTATVLDYGGGDGKTWSGFVQTDVRPDGTVWDMYSNVVRQFNGNLSVTGMNIEHSFAKSWWGGTETQAYFDLHHLNPSDATANQRKSSYVISVVDSTIVYENSVIKVGKTRKKPGYLFYAWEPADEYKGDFARIYMYMVTAYEDYAPLWTNDSEHLLDNNTYPVFEKWVLDILLQWSRQDPVSAKEINRNNVVYSIQGNRNPYIDYPLMAEYVWGERKTMPFTENGVVTYPYLNYPDNADSVQSPLLYLQQSVMFEVPVKGNNLTGSLSFQLSGPNAADFSIGATTMSKSVAEAGSSVDVTVNGNTAGVKTAYLTISGGGLTNIVVKLKAQVSDVFVALPASNIRSNGFTANWTVARNVANYQLNVFSLRPTGAFLPQNRLEEDFLIALPNTWFRDGYTDLSVVGSIRLASSSNFGKVVLPPLDLSLNGARITVQARQYSSDTGAKLTLQVNNTQMVQWTTATAVQTFTIDVPRSTSAAQISLSAIAGKRVYVDYVKVEELMPVTTRIMESGFPVQVANVTSAAVSGLIADSTYYYTVLPLGVSGAAESNSVRVHTDITTGNVKPALNKGLTVNSVSGHKVLLKNIPDKSTVRIYSGKGVLVRTVNQPESASVLQLPAAGVYLLQIQSSKGLQFVKFTCN